MGCPISIVIYPALHPLGVVKEWFVYEYTQLPYMEEYGNHTITKEGVLANMYFDSTHNMMHGQ